MSAYGKRVLIIELIAAGVWIAVILALMPMAGPAGIAGVIFGLVSFLAGGIVLLTLDSEKAKAREMTEVNMVPTVAVYGYLAVSILVNTVFCLVLPLGSSGKVIAINVIFLGILLVVGIGFDPYRRNTAASVERAAEKTGANSKIRAQISQLLAMAEDPEEKQALRKLKESVDYGRSLSQAATRETEQHFLEELEEIQKALKENRPKEEILATIKAAQKTWIGKTAVESALH